MRTHPAGAGYDDDPRRGWDRRRGDVPDGAVVVSSFCPRLNSRFGSLRRSENVSHGLKRSLCPSTRHLANWPNIRLFGVTLPRSAQLPSEAAETLRCARSGGPGPSAEAAVSRDRRDRERQAVRSRGGVVRFAVEAECCGAMGCRETGGLLLVEKGNDRRVLCVTHAQRWVE